MLLRMSTLFLRTLRDDPADAEVPSHRLLVRAGYIRRAAPGGFTWLPLGYRVFRNGTQVGTIRFAASGTTCTVVSATPTTVNAGDVVRVIGPAVPDATLATFGMTIKASLP